MLCSFLCRAEQIAKRAENLAFLAEAWPRVFP